MPAPATSPREATSSRERIDAAALRLLALHGYAGFGMQALANEVGLHKSTLFHHYKSKAQIAEAGVRRVMSKLEDIGRQHLEADAPELERFVAFTQDLSDYLASEPEAAKLLLRVVLAPAGSPLAVEDDSHPLFVLLRMLVAWFDRARRAGTIRWVRIRHTLFDMMGVVVFHPATAPQLKALAGEAPFTPDETNKRREELAAFVRGALSP